MKRLSRTFIGALLATASAPVLSQTIPAQSSSSRIETPVRPAQGQQVQGPEDQRLRIQALPLSSQFLSKCPTHLGLQCDGGSVYMAVPDTGSVGMSVGYHRAPRSREPDFRIDQGAPREISSVGARVLIRF